MTPYDVKVPYKVIPMTYMNPFGELNQCNLREFIIRKLRLRRLYRMSTKDLMKLNRKLAGKGCHFITEERAEVCRVLGKELAQELGGSWLDAIGCSTNPEEMFRSMGGSQHVN